MIILEKIGFLTFLQSIEFDLEILPTGVINSIVFDLIDGGIFLKKHLIKQANEVALIDADDRNIENANYTTILKSSGFTIGSFRSYKLEEWHTYREKILGIIIARLSESLKKANILDSINQIDNRIIIDIKPEYFNSEEMMNLVCSDSLNQLGLFAKPVKLNNFGMIVEREKFGELVALSIDTKGKRQNLDVIRLTLGYPLISGFKNIENIVSGIIDRCIKIEENIEADFSKILNSNVLVDSKP